MNNKTQKKGSNLVQPSSALGGKKKSNSNRKGRPLDRSVDRSISQLRRNDERTFPSNKDIGTVVRTRLTRTGISNIRSMRLSWVAGFTYVGDGTAGTADAVYFMTATSTWIIRGFAAASSGQVAIAASDRDVGQVYIEDIEKHFARKVIKKMWIHVDSLQPSTANNMMAVIGVSRGPNGVAFSIPITAATAAISANTVGNVSSMTCSFPVDSWEHKTVDITEFIASGSGSRQNEFEIQGAPGASAVTDIYVTTTVPPTIDGEGLIPACFAVAGNSTTAGLRGTKVHQITIEQEVDLLDFLGGMALAAPAG